MKYPHCEYQSEFKTVRCPHCNAQFDASVLEERAHLVYLRDRLERWIGDGTLPADRASQAVSAIDVEMARLEARLHVPITPAPAPAKPESPRPLPGRNSPPAASLSSREALRDRLSRTLDPNKTRQPDVSSTKAGTQAQRLTVPEVARLVAAMGDFSLAGITVSGAHVPGVATVGSKVSLSADVVADGRVSVIANVRCEGEKIAETRLRLRKGYQRIYISVPVQAAGLRSLILELAPDPELYPAAAPGSAAPEFVESEASRLAEERSKSTVPALPPLNRVLEDLADRLIDLVRPAGPAAPTSLLTEAEAATEALVEGPEGMPELRRRERGIRAPKLPALPNIRPVLTGRDFSWKEMGSYLLSERTLHALLGLGTFLVLAAGFVISTINPTNLLPVWHMFAVIFTTVLFFAVGAFARFRLHLPAYTSSTLVAIGGAFVPLNLATLGQEGLMNWEPATVWLSASLFCLPVYLLFHVWLHDRTFALFAALDGASLLLSLLNWFGIPPEVAIVSLVALSVAYIFIGWRLRQRDDVLAWALFWTSQTAVPLILGGLKGSTAFPLAWQAMPGQHTPGLLAFSVAAAWWLGVLFYVMCAYLSERKRYQFATAWTVPMAYLFTLDTLGVSPSWYNLCLALLPLGYAVLSMWRGRNATDAASARLRQLVTDPVNQAGLAATMEAALWPANQSLAGRGPSLLVVALTYATYAYRFRHLLLFRYAATYLLAIATGLSLAYLGEMRLAWFQAPWHSVVLAALAGCYLLLGRFAGLCGSTSPAYREMAKEPVFQVAAILAAVSLAWPFSTPDSLAATLTVLFVVFAAATRLLERRGLAYASTALLVAAYAVLSIRPGMSQPSATLGWAVLACLMIVAAEVLLRRSAENSRLLSETVLGSGEWKSRFAPPLLLAGYCSTLVAAIWSALGFAGALTAAPGVLTNPALIVAGLLVVAAACVSSRLRRTSLPLYLAVLVFLFPYVEFTGYVSRWAGMAPSKGGLELVLSLLGAAYVLVAAWLDQFEGHYSKPLYLAGYCLSALPVLTASEALPRVQVMGIAILLYGWSAWRVHARRHPVFEALAGRIGTAVFHAGPALRTLFPSAWGPGLAPGIGIERVGATVRAAFLYLAVWLLPWWVQLLTGLLDPTSPVDPAVTAAAVMAPLYIAVGLGFERVALAYRWPWFIAGYALSVLAMTLAGNDLTSQSVAQGMAVALYAASAWRFRHVVWQYLAAWIFPVWLVITIGGQNTVMITGVTAYMFSFLAVAYTLAGLRLRRVLPQYWLPWFIAANALSVAALPALLVSGWATPGSIVVCLGTTISLYFAYFKIEDRRHWLSLAVALFPFWFVSAIYLLAPRAPSSIILVGLTLLGAGYVGLGKRFEEWDRRYRKPWFAAGYALSVLGPGIALADAGWAPQTLTSTIVYSPTLAVSLLVSIGLYAASFWLFLRPLWLWITGALLPVWAVLALRLALPEWPLGPYGVALALLASLLVGVGWRLRLFGVEYQRPFYTLGYALSVLGPLLSVLDPVPRCISLFVTIALYAASARISGQTRWHHLTSWPLVLWTLLATNLMWTTPWISGNSIVLTLIAPVYFAVGLRLRRSSPEFGRPWFIPAYFHSAVGPLAFLIVPALTFFYPAYLELKPEVFNAGLFTFCFAVSVALYAASAALLRHTTWHYLTAWLFPIWLALALAQLTSTSSLALQAIALTLLAPAYIVLALKVRRSSQGYETPWCVGGCVLSVLGPLVAGYEATNGLSKMGVPESPLLVGCIAVSIALYFAMRRIYGSAAWLLVAIWLFAGWVGLSLRLVIPGFDLGGYSMVLALLAFAYLRLGWKLRANEWYGTTYALSALAPALAVAYSYPVNAPIGVEHVASSPVLASLAISTALYFVSARLFRRHEWLWLAASLLPVLLILAVARMQVGLPAYGISLLVLALIYGVVGVALHNGSPRLVRAPVTGPIHPFALPLFGAGHIVALLALSHTLLQGPEIVVPGFLLGSVVYVGSCLAFRNPLFVTPAGVTLAIAYISVMTMSGLDPAQYGFGLLPGIAAYLFAAEVLRRRAGTDWSITPFLIAYSGTAFTVIYSYPTQIWHLAWWSALAIFAVSTWLFRSHLWLYPTVACALGAYLATLRAVLPATSLSDASVALVVAAWALIWVSHFVASKSAPSPASLPALGATRVISCSWAAPFLSHGALAGIVSLAGGAVDAETGYLTAVAYSLLLAGLATTWAGEIEAWGAVALAVLATGRWGQIAAIPVPELPIFVAASGFGFALLAVVAGAVERKGIIVWRRPLRWSSACLGGGSLFAAGAVYFAAQSGQNLQLLASTIAISGLTLIAHGFARNLRVLGYLGVAAVDGGYMLELTRMQVGQPQAFALPAGIYLLSIAFLEWRRGEDARLKRRLEQAGLTLLLGVSLIQSVGYLGDGLDRSSYNTFLFVECLVLFAAGAVFRWRQTFLWSIAGIVTDVVIMLWDPMRSMELWYFAGLTGLILIGLVLFLQWKRQQIPEWWDEWRERLDSWS